MNERNHFSLKLLTACFLAIPGGALAHDTAQAVPAGGNVHYGQSAALGGASVRTYVVLGSQKDAATNHKPPVEMGIEIPRSVFWGLPSMDTVSLLEFPIQARDTPIQYMMLDWNHLGHEPAGIYDRPHFDFHFYAQDLDEVEDIHPGPCSGLACDDLQRALTPLPSQFTPQGYINVGSVVPFMGNHLVDPTSPEFNGKGFTRTWLYGAYDGRITFYEPMITLDSLLQTPNLCTDIKLPQQYATSGYYPTKYCTALDTAKDVHKVYITGFVYRTAPASK